ncbi:MAG: TonB-dependent receptor, partial [Desulfobaccales bacterium]
GFVITPYKDINIYANRGIGFRSPGVYEISPVGGVSNLALRPAMNETYDVGFNALLFKKLYLAFNAYYTEMEREMVFNANLNRYEDVGDSRRKGLETEVKIFLPKGFTLYGSFAAVNARLVNPTTPGAVFIWQLPRSVTTAGFLWQKSFNHDNHLGLDFYYLYYGRAPLTFTGTVYRPGLSRFLLKATYRWKNWEASLDGNIFPQRYAGEFMVYSKGRGDSAYDPLPVAQVMAGLRYYFKK